jgi:predicted dienelactone hydrolase
LKIVAAVLSALLALAAAVPAAAAGFQHVFAADPQGTPLEIGVWYPSDAAPKPQTLATFSQSIALDAPVAGNHLPLIVMATDGAASYAGHYDTALALAKAGFVVAAVAHSTDDWRDRSSSLHVMDQPRQIVRAIDYLLQTWPDHARIDPARIGIFGFGAGGFAALVDIGGEPDLPLIAPHCREHPKEYVCTLIATDTVGSPVPPVVAFKRLSDPRIKAAVIAAPALGFTFTSEGMKNVSVPVQLWRAGADTIAPSPFYAEPVLDALPGSPDYTVVAKAGHYDFLAPCGAALAAAAPEVCTSPAGFDRAAFHVGFNRSVVNFFSTALAAK